MIDRADLVKFFQTQNECILNQLTPNPNAPVYPPRNCGRIEGEYFVTYDKDGNVDGRYRLDRIGSLNGWTI